MLRKNQRSTVTGFEIMVNRLNNNVYNNVVLNLQIFELFISENRFEIFCDNDLTACLFPD